MSFFHVDRTRLAARAKGAGRVDAKTLHKLGCRACPLNGARVNTPKMRPRGAKRPEVYFLGEAPGKDEDRRGRPFVGASGRLLRAHVPAAYRKAVRYGNVIRDRPPGNRDPSYVEVECCRPLNVVDIEETKPTVIVAVGNHALNWLTGVTGITLWRGRFVPVRVGRHTCWAYPVFHPSSLLRARKKTRYGNEYPSENERVFERDLARLFAELPDLGEPHFEDPATLDNGINTVDGHGGDRDVQSVLKWLKQMSDAKYYVAVDIETNMLRPYGKGAKILTVSVGTYGRSLAFPLYHKQAGWTAKQRARVERAFKKFITSSPCVKIAQNLAFELEWFVFFYGVGVLRASPWADTMVQAFVLDERKGGHSLDVLCHMRFGLPLKNYAGVDVRNLDNEPLDKVLRYNGLDTKFEHLLYTVQDRELYEQELIRAYWIQMRRIPTAVLSQYVGLDIDQGEVRRHQREHAKVIKKLEDAIRNDKAVRRYEERYGELNIGSHDHIITLFRDVLKRREVEVSRGTFSADKEVLGKVGTKLAKNILAWRTATTNKTKYIDALAPGAENVWPDGKVHTVWKSTFVATGRLSSEDPNLQNYPIREHPEIRSVIPAPPGHTLAAFDYGQIEVCVVAMYSDDKNLVTALRDHRDIHMEWAEYIAADYPRIIGGKKFRGDKDVMKALRQRVKGGLVFACFYGARAGTVARQMEVPDDIAEPLWERFWNHFPDVKAWQDRTRDVYDEYGYVEMLTGHRRREPLEGNVVINTPIQGTASHIVVNAWDRLSEHAQATGRMQFQARMNIHDDLTFYLPNKTLEADTETVLDFMLKPEYKFVNVPISVEVEFGDRWSEKEEVGKFFSDEWD